MTVRQPVLTLFYDGHCPICRREIVWLRQRLPHRLAFQDVHDQAFDPATLGVTMDELLAEIHGIGADGQIIKGIDVFAIAYSQAGLPWLAAPLQWSWARPLLQRLYGRFARYRPVLGQRWASRCGSGQCRTE